MIDIEKFICSLMQQQSEFNWLYQFIKNALKDQGLEYKDSKIVPINNKPKFKKGDWVVYDGFTYQITGVYEDGYSNDKQGFIPLKYQDEMRLWDVSKDARDGDVLVASDGSIFLFKCTIDCACIHYVALATDNTVKFNEGLVHYWETSRAVHPATKEQREQFEKAMADAGYEWDAKHKQLKKIEPRGEPTKFEDIVVEIARTAYLNAYGVKGLAKFILSNAKKQLQEEFDKQLEQAYKNADEVQYRRGYRKAVEDAADFIRNNMAGDDNSMRYFHTFMEQKLT